MRNKYWSKDQFKVNDHEDRRLGIGGSDASAIMGANSYKTKYELWLEKTGKTEPEDKDNEYTRWGKFMEDAVLRKYKIRRSNMTWWNQEGSTYRYAHIDGYKKSAKENGGGHLIYEIKAPSFGKKYNQDVSIKELNPSYYWQAIHYLSIFEENKFNKVMLIIASAPYFHHFYVHMSDNQVKDDLKDYLDKSWEFWVCVMENIPVEPETHSDMKLAYPSVNSNEYPNATEEDLENLAIIDNASSEKSALEGTIEYSKNMIRKSIGGYEGLSFNEEVIVSNKEDKNGKRSLRITYQRRDKDDF